MSPSQALSNLDQENKAGAAMKPPETQDDINLRCMNNCEDNTFDMEALLDQQPAPAPAPAPDTTENPEVDVVECLNTSDIRLAEGDDPDATEYSSSFGDTDSGKDDGSRLSDAEVNSRSDGDNGSCSNPYDRLNGLFPRKKKLTAHWRRYIRPLMWRCKWVELRIKEFQSQALKYDRELAAYDQRKLLETGQHVSEDCVRSLPFTRQSYGKEAMKRRKRKRIEDTVDIQSYMSLHNLFSYYENKKSDADGFSVDEDCGNEVAATDFNSNDDFDASREWTSFECRDDDKTLEQILWKIELVQGRVQNMNKQIENLLATNAEKFSSMENLSQLVPSDLPNSSVRSPTSSPGNADTMTDGALYSLRYGDVVIPDSAVSRHGEATPLPDIIESTMILSAAEDQPKIGDSCGDLVENVQIHNQAGAKELKNLETVNTQPAEKPLEPVKPVKEEQDQADTDTTFPCIPAMKSEPVEETTVTQEQSVLKLSLHSEIHVPKNKRKRGERKAGSGAWNAEKIPTQRPSDEPDKHRG